MSDQQVGIIAELKVEYLKPWSQGAFRLYFWLLIVIVGSLSVWISIYSVVIHGADPSLIPKSVAATFLPLVMASVIDMSLTKRLKNMPALSILSSFSILIAVVLFGASYLTLSWLHLLITPFGYLFGLACWVLANSDPVKWSNEQFYKTMSEGAKKLEEDWT